MLTVAIHDVAPSTLGEVRWLLERLDAMGVERRVLKVVPGGPEPGDPGPMVELLHREVAAGSEVVLHGWTHRAGRRLRGSAAARLRALVFADGSAEFLALEPGQLAERVAAGVEWLRQHDLSAVGFCPPAWLATRELAPALREAGFRYLVTLRGLRDLRRGRWVTLPPQGYMAGGPTQERLVRLGATVLSRPLTLMLRAPAHRFFLHPQAATDSSDCARVLTDIAGAARRHRAVTYEELIDG